MKTFLLLALVGVCVAAPAPAKLQLPQSWASLEEAVAKSGGSVSGSMWWQYIYLAYGNAVYAINGYTQQMKDVVKEDNPKLAQSINFQINLAVGKSGAPMGLMGASIAARTLTIRQMNDMVAVLDKIAVTFDEKTAEKVSQLSEDAQESFNGLAEALAYDLSYSLGFVAMLLDK